MRDSGSPLPNADQKRHFVRRMFAAISPRYDLMNRLMTLGRDRRWRRTVVGLCSLGPGGSLLDVATGTGDIAYEALRSVPDARVVGVDLTREMMVQGQGKYPGMVLPFAEGDGLRLPFADDSFDAVCSGFMMRNVLDIEQAFAEQIRVVRPGGRVVCLEITRPRRLVFRQLFDIYFFRVVPFVGGLLSGQRGAYTYLPHSTLVFPRPDALRRTMERTGLRQVRYRLAMLGTIAIHWGTK